jgi:hypothetical protein
MRLRTEYNYTYYILAPRNGNEGLGLIFRIGKGKNNKNRLCVQQWYPTNATGSGNWVNNSKTWIPYIIHNKEPELWRDARRVTIAKFKTEFPNITL